MIWKDNYRYETELGKWDYNKNKKSGMLLPNLLWMRVIQRADKRGSSISWLLLPRHHSHHSETMQRLLPCYCEDTACLGQYNRFQWGWNWIDVQLVLLVIWKQKIVNPIFIHSNVARDCNWSQKLQVLVGSLIFSIKSVGAADTAAVSLFIDKKSYQISTNLFP